MNRRGSKEMKITQYSDRNVNKINFILSNHENDQIEGVANYGGYSLCAYYGDVNNFLVF